MKSRLSAVMAAGALLSGVAAAQTTAEQFAKAVQAGNTFREERLVRVGLLPAAEVAQQRRTVRRFLLIGWPLATPAVELERGADGRETMRIHQWQRPAEAIAAPSGLWEALAKLDAAIYAPPVFAEERERLARPVTWNSCHGDDVTFQRIEAGRVSMASGNQCANSTTRINDAMLAAIRLYAQALMDHRGCTEPLGRSPVDTVGACYLRPQGSGERPR